MSDPIQQRLRKWVKTMKRGPAPRDLIADVSEAADIISTLESELSALKEGLRRIRDFDVAGADCLPGCDRMAHETLCPACNPELCMQEIARALLEPERDD